MPTARELLEQADALMRRNRADQIDDIPVLTDAVPSSAAAPMPALAPSPAKVPEPSRGTPLPAVAPPGHASAVEGEPSDWLEIEDVEPSVIGDAPDSVAVVPPVDLRRVLDEELLQSAEHEEIELTSAVDDEFEAETQFANLPSPAAAPVVEAREGFDLAAAPATETAPASSAVPSAAALAASFAAALPAQVAGAIQAPPEPRWTAPQEPVREAAAVDDAERAHVAKEARPGPDDQAHWDSVAEEIRMQVLQRIDLFTDTGLREQLGQRLKPIVDRASADLVATINQHVGELLRAYVAEAIEREIERWRQDN